MRDVWGALADKTRREILDLLRARPYTAGEIADQFSLSRATVSHHLAYLRETKLVVASRRAQTVLYSLDDRELRRLWAGLGEFLGV